MSRARIAPTLEWLARHDWNTFVDGTPPHIKATKDRETATWAEASRELRALLAVARAAERALLIEQGAAGAAMDRDPLAFNPEDVRTWRAIRRLRRLSGAPRGRGRGRA